MLSSLSKFKQAQRSLDNFFKNIKPLYIENSELGMLMDWWGDAFESNLLEPDWLMANNSLKKISSMM